jgi:hypothetical protein
MFKGTIDAYCVGCKKEAPFRGLVPKEIEDRARLQSAVAMAPIGHPPPRPLWQDELFEVGLYCTREMRHRMRFYFAWRPEGNGTGGTLEKIGQTPSFADLSFPESKRFAKLLGEEKYAEYHKGLGLFAHGANIGAFVYLRRVFEYLVEAAHQAEVGTTTWDEDAYRHSKMEARIRMLSHRLPATLVDNASVYGILSVGVHELTEHQCGAYFETVHRGIELILSDELARRERDGAVAAVKTAIEDAARELKDRKPKGGAEA